MNVTPEVIQRLRRIAGLERMSRKNGEENKKEVDQNGNENDKVRDTSSGGNSSEGNGGLSPEMNSTENDMATPGSKQEKGEGALKRDMDVFRQILKEVIITRTLAIETKVMGDVEALKKQVFELEAQKERLQCDSERLQQTLNEISSKHEKQKAQLISCGTQVDMDLIQERPLSPEISKPIKPPSASEKSISFNKMQHPKIANANQAQTVDPEQVVTYNIDENAVSLEKIKTADRTKTPESRLHCNDSGIGTTQNVPVAAENATKTLSDKDVTLGVSVLPPSQAQGITTGSVVTRDQQNELHVREIRTVENPQAPSAHRPPQALRVEVPRPEQERGNIYQQSPRVDMHQHAQTRGPPPLRPTVPSGNPPITGQHQVHLPQRSTETPPPYGTQYSSSRWLASQPQPPNQQGGHVELRRHPFVNNTPIEQANPRSIATIPRGPPNVSLFHPPKRRRVDNLSASDGPHMHAVSNNNSYVMHNFKVQMTPRALEAERAKKYVQISGSSPTNQAVYTTSPSNQLPGTYLNQGVPNTQPTVYPDQYPFRAKDNALERPAVGLSQGQLVERVFYPSKGSQSGGNEYHRDPTVMPAQHVHRRYTERAHATDQPAEPNSMVYVVQEYQVSRNHGNRAAPVQTIAPAPPAVPRNITYSPVQSPGITSTASPSGCRPGESNTGLVPRAASNPSDTPAVRIGHQPSYSRTPPKPTASIVVVQDGIVLSWNMRLDEATVTIENYELFACQDGAESTKPPIMWKKIGIVKALPLPMACTLTQFSSGNKYHFAVRAVDDQERAGPFSDPCTISLTN